MAKKKPQSEEQLIKLGKRLRELRIEKGYTNYEQFAFDNEIPRAQYGRYENGSDLRLSSLIKVLDALGITLAEFFSKGFD
ncbi:MAG: transcriptional regulator [Pseudozobellia sp.]|nr:transcriptional regulator [Pseudozobellia sp.]MBG48946.1 transcriptional regulator [Pseudozobellia sp.]|tara:strand:+ start:1412 stop:1651 length:240 start_codon:yes stop_codon:yes gene_type:complete